ncbi:replication restart helicase PriA [Haliovirga abyssi]|uniref:Replication restart protein PriA n=1 Tax=Haliovirga abyssi TaxID=2996794 RepID=A0AAU9E1M5_9FUSO|nr:primosomal protein N' [Haliovirga abyssi]BDU50280.1 primosomal protein N' [Haliovirga abyssi]
MRYYSLYVSDTKTTYFTYGDKNNEFEVGEWVFVNFRNKKKAALILFEEEEREFKFKVKNIIEKIPDEIKIDSKMIELFLWISDYYLTEFGEVLTAAIPKNVKIKYRYKYFYNASNRLFEMPLETEKQAFIDYIKKRGNAAKSTLISKFGKKLLDEFEKKNMVTLKKEVLNKNNNFYDKSEYSIKINKTSDLTNEQKNAKYKISSSNKKYFLLKGITGSGKTEIYIKLIQEALENGDGAIFLIPEISLTPQMTERLKRSFEDKIAILHSRLSDMERGKEWRDIYLGNKRVVVGVRSAIFSPIKNLKYIIVDEEHETTYKQESEPRYNAKYVAIKRAELEGCKVIFGSATPSIESYYFAKTGVFELIELKNRYNNAKLPKIEIVDMKDEKQDNFSEKLLQEISKRLRKKEQVLIFLNRKGYSNFIQCKECGHVETCEDCSVSLSYHKKENKLKCNYCGKEQVFLGSCSKCGSKKLKYYGKGTEKLEYDLKEYFKDVNILRVDSETVKEKGSYERIYKDFLDGKYEILLGTQIIAKGFHFPNITLVGIVSADSTLNFPDFRAGERTFQLIVQSSGRAGRGKKDGEVLIQTYIPEHYVIQKSLTVDYDGFYEEEINLRKELEYPPFGKIINIIISSVEESELFEKANEFYNLIKNSELEIYGPFEAPIYKIKNRYRYQIFIKGERKEINNLKKQLKKEYNKFKIKNKNVRITIDVDPVNMA